jgi:DHA1 family bicyclomycin/chloramphenicol resistance-like MFS transporter
MTTHSAEDRREAVKKPLSTFRYAMLMGALIAFGPPLSIDTYLPALPAMGSDLHANGTLLQLTLTTFIIGMSLGQLIVGPITDAIGRRKPLLFGLSLYVTASALCGVSVSIEMLIAMRALQALGAAACLVTVRAITRDLFSGTTMTRFFSMLILVTGSAPVIAPILGGQLLRLTSWHGIFLALSILGALLLMVAVVVLPESLPTSARVPVRWKTAMRTYAKLLKEPVFLGYVLTTGFVSSQVFAYLAGSSFALQGVYRLTPQEYSFVFGINAIATVAGSQITARLVGRFSERTLLRTSLSFAVLCGAGNLWASTASAPLLALLIPLWLQIFFAGMALPNLSSLSLAEYPHMAGAASALVGVIPFAMGGLVGPLLSLGDGSNAVLMTSFLMGLAILAFATYLILIRGRAQSHVDERAVLPQSTQ